MGRRASYSDAEWDAHAKGESLAESRRPLKIPSKLTILEQSAFCEGYGAKREEIRNRSVVADIKGMLGGASFGRIIQDWVRHYSL